MTLAPIAFKSRAVSCCECFGDAFSVLVRAVSFAVSFSRHSVDLRVHCYDTDAQNFAGLLLGVVTRLPSESHGVQGVAGSNPAVPIRGRDQAEKTATP